MDPFEFARQHGQVIGSKPDQPYEPSDVKDLMDMLVQAFVASGQYGALSADAQVAVSEFADFGNEYLATHRVVSTGVVDGEFSLVFESGHAVPLASSEPAKPARPDATIPITMPRDSKMKGMPVVDNSVPVTTGTVGSPTRKPG